MGIGRTRVEGHPEQQPVREALRDFIAERPGKCQTHRLRAAATFFGVHEATVWGWLWDNRPIPDRIAYQFGYKRAWIQTHKPLVPRGTMQEAKSS